MNNGIYLTQSIALPMVPTSEPRQTSSGSSILNPSVCLPLAPKISKRDFLCKCRAITRQKTPAPTLSYELQFAPQLSGYKSSGILKSGQFNNMKDLVSMSVSFSRRTITTRTSHVWDRVFMKALYALDKKLDCPCDNKCRFFSKLRSTFTLFEV